jgi:hypothetical protein
MTVSFYKDKERKIKKKRLKISSKPHLKVNPPINISAVVWNCRYDLKLGVFSELRSDFETALKFAKI